MRKTLILIVISMFVSLLFVPGTVLAAGTTSFSVQATSPPLSQPSESASKPDSSTYLLPFPGMLPDNPFYFLKLFRDFIMDTLINDPYKRVEFNVLQSDKRLSMGLALFNNGNVPLAIQQFTEGQKYLEKTTSSLIDRKSATLNVPTYLVDELDDSLYKHIQVLTDLVAKTTDPGKSDIQALLDRTNTTNLDLLKLR
jgi:hypothetical protein